MAIMYWFGVSSTTVWNWRKALGVAMWEPEGSRRLHQQTSEAGAAKHRGKRLPPDQVERRRRTALELGLRPPGRTNGRPWTRRELAMLGSMPDEQIAARIDRTATAVRVKRTALGIATAEDRRRREHRQGN
jgi:hypothetical protein